MLKLRAMLAALVVISATPRLSVSATLPEYGRPLSPAEGRQMKATIARLSRDLKVREATLKAVARAAGAEQPGAPFETIIVVLKDKAREAGELREQVSVLQIRIAGLDAQTRAPALALLDAARKSIDEGRLDDADRDLVRLSELRWPETLQARESWIEAVRFRAKVAMLRLDEPAAAGLLRTARLEERRLSQALQWRLAVEEAEAYFVRGRRWGDHDALKRNISILRDEALPLVNRDSNSAAWVETQQRLGVGLGTLGKLEGGTESLQEAVVAYRAALNETSLPADSEDRVELQRGLGLALWSIGLKEQGVEHLELAISAYGLALDLTSRTERPQIWAKLQNDLASAYWTLGQRRQDELMLRKAITGYEATLAVRTREDDPIGWALAQNNIGTVWLALGQMNDDAEAMESAIQAFRSALLEFRQDDRPLYWATAQGNLGVALSALGEMTGDKGMLAEAVEVMRASLDEATRERDPFNWGLTQYNIGRNLTELGRLETGVTALQAAYAAQGEALKERTRARNPFQWAVTLEERSALLLLLHERTGDLSYLDRAIVEATEAISGYEEAGDAESATALKEQIDELSAERAPPRP